MSIADVVGLIMLGVAGGLLAIFYFGGLWLTVRAIPDSRRPWLLYFVSAAARLAILLTALFLLMAGDWHRMIVCMAGFVICRLVIVHSLLPSLQGVEGVSGRGR